MAICACMLYTTAAKERHLNRQLTAGQNGVAKTILLAHNARVWDLSLSSTSSDLWQNFKKSDKL
jgi:hypothetical protein